MNCIKCKTEIDVGNVEMDASCTNGIDVEVTFHCPNCNQLYGTFFDSEDFIPSE